jgi:eukaryotic-like serine/threonine-protein kinase
MKLVSLIGAFIFITLSCKKNTDTRSQPPPVVLSDKKEILSFSFKASDNAGVLTQDAVGIIDKDTIWVTVDAINISNLVPYVTHNGKEISPASGSGNSFTNPVFYSVTAQNDSVRKYVVIVNTSASLYIGSQDGNLYAFNAGNGKLRWKYQLPFSVKLNPTYANGTVFIGNSNYLYALNSSTGELKWKTFLDGGTGTSPQVVNNIVYTTESRGSNTESYIVAINAITGAINWKKGLPADFIICSPTVADGKVVTAGFTTGLYCFDAVTGQFLWTFPTGIVRDNPAIVNGTLYIGSEGYQLVAIDMNTGLKKWAINSYWDNNNQLIHGVGNSPTVANGVVYTGGNLTAYDIATGNVLWKYNVSPSAVVRPVYENGVLFGTSPGDLVFAVNSNGTLKWKIGNFGSIQPAVELASATVANQILFTGCGMNNSLKAINTANGQIIWNYQGTQPFTSGPCVVDGKNNVFHSNTSGAQN